MIKNKFKKGFTLIELLVVVAIIGILAAIVYSPFQAAKRKARDAKRVSEMKDIQTSIEMYADSYQQYPGTMAILQASQSDKLPVDVNFGTSYDATKYNYTAYQDTNNKVINYHLYTHLETASPALDGRAGCAGTTGASPCAASGTTIVTGAVNEPGLGVAAFTSTSSNTDAICKTNTIYCIYDLRG